MPNSKKPTSKKPARKTTKKVTAINPEDLKRMISEAAYYLAEQRGFEEGNQLHDWLEAKAKIHHIYGKTVSNK